MSFCPDERCKFWHEPDIGAEKTCCFPWWGEPTPEDKLCRLCGDREEEFDD